MDSELETLLLQVPSLVNVIREDSGALLTPICSLATLMLMFILNNMGN